MKHAFSLVTILSLFVAMAFGFTGLAYAVSSPHSDGCGDLTVTNPNADVDIVAADSVGGVLTKSLSTLLSAQALSSILRSNIGSTSTTRTRRTRMEIIRMRPLIPRITLAVLRPPTTR
ncbi:MAG: hypothetical protein ACYSRP_06095 [Planctomycetota bacterium]|jgi:hypothetical protein